MKSTVLSILVFGVAACSGGRNSASDQETSAKTKDPSEDPTKSIDSESIKKHLNAIKVSFLPPPGSYDYGFVARVEPSEKYGALEFKKAEDRWGTINNCINGSFSTVDIVPGEQCIAIDASKKLTWRIRYSIYSVKEVFSDEQTVSYEVDSLPRNLTINGSEFTEAITECQGHVVYSNNKRKMDVRIKLQSKTVASNKDVYLFFSLPDISANGSVTLASGPENGVTILATGTQAENLAHDYWIQSHKQDSCTVTIDGDYEKTGKASGTISCPQMSIALGKSTELGNSLVISKSPWACDKFHEIVVPTPGESK